MNESKAENNKAIVLEAFHTLFNKRDYIAAERFWSPNYIQHSAHIEPGRDGLFNLVKEHPPHPQVSAGSNRSRGRLRHHSRPLLGLRSAGQLDCGGYYPHERRNPA